MEELNIDKSINEKVLFHFGINKKPNFEKINLENYVETRFKKLPKTKYFLNHKILMEL